MIDYRFIDKDPVIDYLRTAFSMMPTKRSYKDIAKAARLYPGTITNLLFGKTRRPQNRTVVALFEELGVEVKYFYKSGGEEVQIAKDIWRQFVRRQKKAKRADNVVPLRRKRV